MGLITKEVEVKLGGTNVKHFEKLGYKIPRRKDKQYKIRYERGATIKVRVEDLQPSSNVEVELECDGCGIKSISAYGTYVQHNYNGLTYCSDCSHKIFLSGENSPLWNPNLTQEERENGRNYPEYTEFVRRVLARDNYTCQVCGQVHGVLEVHHLNGYSWYIEGRTDETNAITLCENCHSNFHSIYGNKHSTKEEFEEWFGKTVELVECNVKISPCKEPYCIETNASYNSVPLMCEEIGIPFNAKIYDICNKVRGAKTYYGYHFLWHDDYLRMSKDDINEYLEYCDTSPSSRKVICITSGKIFVLCKYAEEYYKISTSNIIKCCRGRQKSAGKLQDGTKLQWMYYEDFLKLPIEEQQEILARNKDSSNDGSLIISKDN